MLSCLINSGLTPAIIEPGDKRRIYNLGTDNGDYKIYAKYASSPTRRKKKEGQLWQFSFSTEEIQFIRNYDGNGKRLYFVLICGRDKLQNSEIAILSLEEVKDCLDVDFDRESYRIVIKLEKGTHGLKAYGTGRADILNGRDNTIRLRRDILSYFKDSGE